MTLQKVDEYCAAEVVMCLLQSDDVVGILLRVLIVVVWLVIVVALVEATGGRKNSLVKV